MRRTPTNVARSLNLVACGSPVQRLKMHLCMRRCFLRFWYSGRFPFSSTLP
uniref:Predicted protein n=1 Tax=Hordeum vulgare subsp. vulgare TaxID=112509 RepID=F2CW29_HORVV|nr:predicted protein [Hordeum vulgare subsp. vulgare]